MHRLRLVATLQCLAARHRALTLVALVVAAFAVPAPAAPDPELQPLADGLGSTYKVQLNVGADPEWPLDGVIEIVLDHDGEGHGYAFRLEATRARLLRRDGNREVVLALGNEPPMAAVPMDVTVARDRSRLRLIINGRIWLSAYDSTYSSGAVALGTNTERLTIDEPLVQSVEGVWFTDDFMRGNDTDGQWTPREGRWTYSGVSDDVANGDKRPDPNLSSNPFAYRTEPGKSPSLATVGYWFWDNYRFEVSVRAVAPLAGQVAAGDAALGVVACLHDADNYLAFRWRRGGLGVERQLVAVIDGQEQILAVARGGWADDQWYRIGIEAIDGRLAAFIDGERVLTAQTAWLPQGEIGVWASGVTFADFDDARAASSDDTLDTFAGWDDGRWVPDTSRWSVDATRTSPSGGGVLRLDGGEGICLTGEGDGSSYRVAADCHAGSGGGFGLVAAWHDPQNYLLFRWGDRSAPSAWRNKCQLLRVQDGRAELLGQYDVPFRRDLWHRLELELREGLLRAWVGDQLAFEVFEPDLRGGRAGVVGAGDVAFDRAEVAHLAPEADIEFTTQFTKEDTMAAWATAAGSWWVGREAQRGGVTWHRGDFYGDHELVLDAGLFGQRARALRLILAGDGQRADSGYSLLLAQAADNSSAVTADLQVGGQSVQRAALDLGGAATVRFAVRGRLLLGHVDDTCVIRHLDQQGAGGQGVSVGVETTGPRLDLERVQARATNSFDTSFGRAPTEWYAAKGIWETINRWACDPRWSFFGGYNDKHPLIWSKADYAGDVTLEAYMAIKMDMVGPPHYLHPSDLCLTVDGDGKDVLSGYSFLFAARNNTCALLYRDGELIGENTSPEAKFKHVGPGGEGLTEFHRHWFHLVLRKHAGRITCSVDDKVLFDVEDPTPLSGGKVALWSVNNGVMVSRVKVWYEKPGEPQAFPDIGALQAEADTGESGGDPFSNGFEQGIGTFRQYHPRHPVLLSRSGGAADGRHCLQMTNLTTGGFFGVRATDQPFDVAERPRLRFAYRVGPDVHTHISVKARGVWHIIPFTGEAKASEGQRLLDPIAEFADDGRWHRADYPLAEAFAKLYQDRAVRVEDVVFCMYEPDPYLHAGFGGNRFGATWYLDDFSIGR